MGEVDFEIQQWGELTEALVVRVRLRYIHKTTFPRRVTTKRKEHSRRSGSRVTLKTQWEQYPSRAWRSRWPWRLRPETSVCLVTVESLV